MTESDSIRTHFVSFTERLTESAQENIEVLGLRLFHHLISAGAKLGLSSALICSSTAPALNLRTNY